MQTVGVLLMMTALGSTLRTALQSAFLPLRVPPTTMAAFLSESLVEHPQTASPICST